MPIFIKKFPFDRVLRRKVIVFVEPILRNVLSKENGEI
jgi:hypothetical protein